MRSFTVLFAIAYAAPTFTLTGCGECTKVDNFDECAAKDAACNGKEVSLVYSGANCYVNTNAKNTNTEVLTPKAETEEAEEGSGLDLAKGWKLDTLVINEDQSKSKPKWGAVAAAPDSCGKVTGEAKEFTDKCTYDSNAKTTTCTGINTKVLADDKKVLIFQFDADIKAPNGLKLTFKKTIKQNNGGDSDETMSDADAKVCAECPFTKGQDIAEWEKCFAEKAKADACFNHTFTLTTPEVATSAAATGSDKVVTADFTKIAEAHPADFKLKTLKFIGAKTCDKLEKIKVDGVDVTTKAKVVGDDLVVELPEDSPMGKIYSAVSTAACKVEDGRKAVLTSAWTSPEKGGDGSAARVATAVAATAAVAYLASF